MFFDLLLFPCENAVANSCNELVLKFSLLNVQCVN